MERAASSVASTTTSKRSNFPRVSPTPVQGVHQEKSSKSSTASCTADGQSAEECGRDQGIARESLVDRVRKSVEPDTVCGKSVVAENATTGIYQDERCGHPPFGILAGLPVKVFVQFRNTRAKSTAIV